MLDTPHPTAAEKDREAFEKSRAEDLTALLRHASKKSGRSSMKVGQEFVRLNASGKFTISEYVQWKLYDETRYTPEERAAFISNKLHWPITNTIADTTWHGAAEDKFIAGMMLEAGGVPVPQIVGVIDPSMRTFPNAKRIRTGNDLKQLALAHADTGLFGKITGGITSMGAFSMIAADETHLTCAGHEPMTYDTFMAEFVGKNPYLIQKTLKNDPAVAPFCSGLATVRMLNMVDDDCIINPVAAFKMPFSGNIVDAFWRPGNLVGEVDLATGTIKTVVAHDGPELAYLDDHPEVAGLMGMQLPYWDKVREINEMAAQIYAPARYNSTDVALTPDGPVIIEVNFGGSFELPQNASGRGLLTPEVKAFFEKHGVDFATLAKGKSAGRGLFGRKK